MAETPKLLIPLKPKEERSSGVSRGASALLNYNANREVIRTNRDAVQNGKSIQTPELDKAVGNVPGFTTTQNTEQFVAPSQRITEEDYTQQKNALNEQLKALQMQGHQDQLSLEGYLTVEDRDRLNAAQESGSQQVRDIERQLEELEQRFAASKYEDVYSKMGEENLAMLREVPALMEQRWAMEGDVPDRQKVGEANARLLEIRNALAASGFSQKEIDSLFDRQQKEYNAQQTQARQLAEVEAARERSGAANLVRRTFSSLASGVGVVDAAIQRMTAGEDAITGQRETVDYNTFWQNPYNINVATTQGQNERIAANMVEKYGNTERAQKATQWRVKANDIAASIGQSAAVVGLTAFGVPGATLLLGGSAATATMHQYHDMGYSDGQAITLGLAAGAVESLTEKIGVDNLFKLRSLGGLKGADLAKAIGVNLASQSGAEAGEEALATIFNTIADAIALGNDNSYRREVNELVMQGMTQEQAERVAIKNWVVGMLGDALAGGISGLFFGGAQAPVSLLSRNLDAVVQQAKADEEAGVLPSLDAVVSETQNAPTQEQAETDSELADTLPVDATVTKAEKKATSTEVVTKLRNSIPEMENIESVSNLTGNEFPKSERKITEQVGDFFRSIGNRVFRNGLGSVILDERGVKSDIAHGIGRAKAVTFAAVPDVIQNGVQIDFQENWKGRGYNTYVFAAPITLSGERSYVAAVVRSDSQNRFYLHEVVDANGNVIYTKDAPTAIETGVTAQDGITGTAEASSETNIPQSGPTVNGGTETQTPPAAQPVGTPGQPNGPTVNGQGPYHPINEQGAASAKATYGRNPVNVPVTNFEGHLTSKTSSTIINSGLTPNGVAESLTDLLNKGELSRIRLTDADAVASAQETIAEKGYAGALDHFHTEVANGQRGKKLMALGIELFNESVNRGDIMTATDIAVDIVDSAREQAQAIQVLNLFNKATPEGRVYFAVKGMDKLISKMEKRYGDRAKGIKVSEELLSDYYKAVKSGDEQSIKESWQEVQKDIAAQIPPNWKDRLNAWRYLAMLGNPKTHIRNMAGNLASAPFRLIKNGIGASLEIASGTKNRTKAFINLLNVQDRALMQMAWTDYTAAMDGTDTGHYDESANDIDRMRKALPGVVDDVAKFNQKALAAEDRLFSRPAYMAALAGWFKANNITPQQVSEMMEGKNPETLAKAREYAIREAKKATYQDSNALSDAISKLGAVRSDANAVEKVGAGLVNAVLPFKRTPANVLMRSIEYSPAYIVRGVGEMLTGVRSGKVTAAEAIDHLSSGLTGSGVMLLGFFLAHQGVLTGSGDDDEEQDAFNKLQGKQDYALTFGDKSFTIDWLSPMALPLFVGAEVYSLINRKPGAEKAKFQDYLGALLSITDPILETSMLSGINDVIDSGAYSDAPFLSIAGNIAKNYLNSFIPTAFGQGERANDERRQETYRYNESNVLNSSGQYALGNMLNKVPGKDYGQIDYVDAWGRTQDYGPLNGLNQFFNPAYVSQVRTTEVETELQRLYDAGQSNVFPERRAQSVQISTKDENGNTTGKRYLTAEEYEQFNRTQGQTALELVSDLMESDLYKGMSDDERGDAVRKIYEYARAVATQEVEPNTKMEGFAKDAQEALQSGMNFSSWYPAYSEWKKLNDTKRDGYSATDKASDFSHWVDTAGFTPAQADMLKSQLTFSSGFTAEATRYNDLTATGLSPDVSSKFYEAASDLKPVNFADKPASWQTYEAVANVDASAAEIDKAMIVYMGGEPKPGETNNTITRYHLMRDHGFTPQQFAAAYHYSKTAPNQETFNAIINTVPGLFGWGDILYKFFASSTDKNDLARWTW